MRQVLTHGCSIVLKMKIYLDDERDTPNGWFRAYWPDEVINLLKNERVDEINLDHDLGNDLKGTGYDVLLWVEEQVFLNGYKPPKMRVYSANSSARIKMELAIERIKNRYREGALDQ